MSNYTTPSSKVVVSTLTAMISVLVIALAEDTSILSGLPGWLEAMVAGAVVGLAGYFKNENNPAPSTIHNHWITGEQRRPQN